MAAAIQRIIPMALEKHEPYYTLQPKTTHIIKANEQVLQVVSGVAWVSNLGEDYVLRAGEAITLMRGGDHVAVISPMFNKDLRYRLRGE